MMTGNDTMKRNKNTPITNKNINIFNSSLPGLIDKIESQPNSSKNSNNNVSNKISFENISKDNNRDRNNSIISENRSDNRSIDKFDNKENRLDNKENNSVSIKKDSIQIEKQSGQSLKVVIRIRPLSDKELNNSDLSCTIVDNNQIAINPTKNKNDNKTFAFDKVFDEKSNQDSIFNDATLPIINHVLDGSPGTIFCYGQTGSGKTFTMQGKPGNPGIIQHVSKLFEAKLKESKESKSGDDEELTIHASFLEVYMEEIIDLMVDRKDRTDIDPNNKLLICEDPHTGVFVKNLTSRQVLSPDDLQKMVVEASSRRTVAATNMNDESSRSHLVISIMIKKTKSGDALGLTNSFSHINLVDLAGSERVEATGATGLLLKQAVKINLSLSALGNVISALCSGNKHIPFRDSKLTRLLQSSFQGDSMTLVIGCLSPATSNALESISTLRFADRAKQIRTRIVTLVDAKQQRIMDLEREVRRLRKVLMQCKCGLYNEIADIGIEIEDDSEDNVDNPKQILGKPIAESGCCIIS